jgi:hypothetical protein
MLREQYENEDLVLAGMNDEFIHHKFACGEIRLNDMTTPA